MMMSKRAELEEQLTRLAERVARLEADGRRRDERLTRLERRVAVSRSDWSPVKEVKDAAGV